jgi:hypothetical protein
MLIRRSRAVEEFDRWARATPRDHKIYRTAKLELVEDVEGREWYGNQRRSHKVDLVDPLPSSCFFFVCGLFVQACSCMASRAVTGCENKDNQTLFLTTTITNTNMLEKE